MFNYNFNNYAPRNPRYSRNAYQKHMLELWEENALCIKYVIDYSMSDVNVYQEMSTRLNKNLKTIADIFVKLYGDSDLINQLFNNVGNLVLMCIDSIRWRKDLAKFRSEWYKYVDSLVSHLHEFVDSNVRELFYKQMRLIEGLVVSFLNKNAKEMNDYCYNQLLTNNRVLSMTLFNGLVNNNKKVFV